MTEKKQKVFIATPSIDGSVDVRYVQSLLASTSRLKAAKISYQVSYEIGNSIVSSARNNLVSQFMASDATDLMFVDADLSWPVEAMVDTLAYDEPFVAGVYQTKDAEKTNFAVKFLDQITREKGLIEVKRVGTGFMRLRRDCLEKMMAAYPQLKLKDKSNPDNDVLYALFDNQLVEGAYVGEDYTFCDRWRKIGGRVLVDPALNFSHWGNTPFDGKLLDFLKS